MIRTLRQLQWIPAFLLLASPAVGGQVLSRLHPCPATGAPIIAATSEVQHHHGMVATVPAHGHEAGDACTCLGSCHAPASTIVPSSATSFVVPDAAPNRPSWPLVEASDPVGAPADRLPPKTAPPLV